MIDRTLLQCAVAVICVFNFGLWLIVILALRQIRTALLSVSQDEQSILTKENQIMADEVLTKAQFLVAIAAAVTELKTSFQAGLDKEKAEVLAILDRIAGGGSLTAADLATVVGLIKGVGTTSLAALDTLSDSVATKVGDTGAGGGGTGGGGGTENPAP